MSVRTFLFSLFLVAIPISGCGSADATGEPEREAADLPDASETRVEAASLKPATATLDLSLPAEVKAKADSMVASAMGGHVDSVAVREGQWVKKGSTIAKLDVSLYAAQRDIAEAQATQAKAEFERILKLGKAATAQQKLAAETQAKVTEANARLARLSLSRSFVKAPFSGKVIDVFVDPGEVAGPGTPIARIVRTDEVSLEISVSDRMVHLVKEGQEIAFRPQSVPQEFYGTIESLGAAADSATRTFKAKVTLGNSGGELLPGMLGRVELGRTVATNAIVIPQDWVITKLDTRGVYTVVDSKAVWTEITLGDFTRDQVVVNSGLKTDDVVVSKGGRGLVDGDSVIVVRKGNCCTDGRVNW